MTSLHKQYIPPHRLLCGPGPSNVSPRVLSAMARPTIGHLDPSFVEFMERLKQNLRTVFRTENKMTMPVSGPGSAAMEMAVVNMVEAGDEVVVCQNGVFGTRFKGMIERAGGKPIMIEHKWGQPASPERLDEALKANADAKLVCFVHAETSTGALSDAKSLTEVAHKHGAMVIMDAVTSLAGVAVEIDEWAIDVVYSGSQKCLSCPPGIAPISVNDRALEHIKNRKTPVQSWFLDIAEVSRYWGEGARSYHHTAPINMLYAFDESLSIVLEEGLEESWERHKILHKELVSGLEGMGLKMLVDRPHRLPQLNTVVVPDEATEASLRQRLLHDYQIEIGAGLGPLAGKVWRIGLMGESCRRRHVAYLLTALGEVLK